VRAARAGVENGRPSAGGSAVRVGITPFPWCRCRVSAGIGERLAACHVSGIHSSYSAALLSLPHNVLVFPPFLGSSRKSSPPRHDPSFPFLARGFPSFALSSSLFFIFICRVPRISLRRPWPLPIPHPGPHLLQARCGGGVREAQLSKGQAPGRDRKGHQVTENEAPGGVEADDAKCSDQRYRRLNTLLCRTLRGLRARLTQRTRRAEHARSRRTRLPRRLPLPHSTRDGCRAAGSQGRVRPLAG
jgi:hypothetical protein